MVSDVEVDQQRNCDARPRGGFLVQLNLKRMIDEQVKLPISARWKEGSHFIVKAVEGEIVVESALSSVADVIEFGDVA